ncbi:unnamed protein product, partial [marine sediment metagenome]
RYLLEGIRAEHQVFEMLERRWESGEALEHRFEELKKIAAAL